MMCPPQCRIIRGYVTLECLLPGDANLNGLVKVMPARFLHYKVSLSPFLTKRYLGQRGVLGDYTDILFLLKLLPTNFSIHQCILYTTIIAIFPHSSTLINWNSSVRRSHLFSPFLFIQLLIFI